MLPALSEHRHLRYGTFLALYVAQGLPEGLLYVAVPAWLAQQGVSAGEIGAFIGVILLPWSFKLINGSVMDRFSFLPMGRRRPWVISAQVGMIVSLLSLTMVEDAAAQMSLITVIGFLVNFFGAFQDVAVDGMAIDIIPENEQARANGLMWGGKTLGIALSTALSGVLISVYGLDAGAISIAGAIALIMLVPLLTHERPGERLLPWSAGTASTAALELQLHSWRKIFAGLFKVVWTPSSLIFTAAIFIALMGYGLYTAALPVMAVQELGWADTDYTSAAATIGILGAAFAMIGAGSIATRFGLVRTLVATLILTAILHWAMTALSSLWDFRAVLLGYMVGFKILFVLMSVAIYAAAMRLCRREVAATQFAIYMAFVNLGTSAGAALLGLIQNAADYAGVLIAMGAIVAVAALAFGRVNITPPNAKPVGEPL